MQYLGVSNSSVFLANCSIWVEGISDRNYLKAFLKAYCRDTEKKNYPKEDIDFAFIEYAGSNIDHYNFNKEELKEKINAFAINNKIFLISDYDGEYRNEKHRFYYSYKHENFSYKTTKPYKEIENLLHLRVWNKILIHFCNNLMFLVVLYIQFYHYNEHNRILIHKLVYCLLRYTHSKLFHHEHIYCKYL